MTVNFDPDAILKTLEEHAAKVGAVETMVEELFAVVRPVLHVLSSFLPASSGVGKAEQTVEELEAEMLKLKDFVTNVLPELHTLLGNAGVGAAQVAGVTLPDGALKAIEPPNGEAKQA